MGWTEKTPTEPGFYFVRYKDNKGTEDVAKIMVQQDELYVSMTGAEYEEYYLLLSDLVPDLEWSDAIPIPEG